MSKSGKSPAGARVLILGASDKEERYAYKAFNLLKEAGFEIIPVHPHLKRIGEQDVFSSLKDVSGMEPIDTVTLYVNGNEVLASAEEIASLRPRRVIMNPGTENAAAARLFIAKGIEVLEACTLVLLKTGQF